MWDFLCQEVVGMLDLIAAGEQSSWLIGLFDCEQCLPISQYDAK